MCLKINLKRKNICKQKNKSAYDISKEIELENS